MTSFESAATTHAYADYHNLPPHYVCSVSLAANLLLKPELDDPQTASFHRRWSRVHAELCGTKLILRSEKGTGANDCITYTLQGAEAGLAADYQRRSFVIRVRAEGHQFLLAAGALAAAVDWVDKLNAAINVSLQLDDRPEPKYTTLLRPYVKVLPPFFAEVERLWREEWRISRRHRAWLEQPYKYTDEQQQCPALAAAYSDCSSANNSKVAAEHYFPISAPPAPSSACHGSCPCSQCFGKSHPISAAGTAPSAAQQSAWLSPCRQSDRHFTLPLSSTKQDLTHGANMKTRPPASSSAQRKLEYARRCARVLRYNAPWDGWCYVRNGRFVDIPKLRLATSRV